MAGGDLSSLPARAVDVSVVLLAWGRALPHLYAAVGDGLRGQEALGSSRPPPSPPWAVLALAGGLGVSASGLPGARGPARGCRACAVLWPQLGCTWWAARCVDRHLGSMRVDGVTATVRAQPVTLCWTHVLGTEDHYLVLSLRQCELRFESKQISLVCPVPPLLQHDGWHCPTLLCL